MTGHLEILQFVWIAVKHFVILIHVFVHSLVCVEIMPIIHTKISYIADVILISMYAPPTAYSYIDDINNSLEIK